MDKKTCLIKQPAGLGDILYTQGIYKHMLGLGYEVIWPIIDEFLWLNDYLDTKFVSLNSDFKYKEYLNNNKIIETSELLYLPIQDSDRLIRGHKIMESKYKLINLDPTKWLDYFTFNRIMEREDKLFYNELGLNNDSEYCLILRNYGSPPNFLKYPINYNGDLKVIELDFHENYTLFDWCKVIENATELHLIDSSINYIIERLNLKSKNVNLYSRRGHNFSEIDYIFKQEYIFKI